MRPTSMLDKVLQHQAMVAVPLLPTPTNINPVHVPGDDLLHFVRVQQWVQDNLQFSLPLLDGMFVLVPSAALSHSQPAAAAIASAIPWRLRQVLRVELGPPGSEPAAATVVLVGGDRLAAGDVGLSSLAEFADHPYLCCDLAHLQLQRQMVQLQVLDVAHMAWRLRVACEAEDIITQKARPAAAQAVSSILRSLPHQDWVGQVMQYIELNPYAWPESPEQPWQLLSAGQYSQLVQDAAAAWQSYVQKRVAGQAVRPVAELVPWLPLDGGGEDSAGGRAPGGSAAAAVAAAATAAAPAAAGAAATATTTTPALAPAGKGAAAAAVLRGGGRQGRSRSTSSQRTASRSCSRSRGRSRASKASRHSRSRAHSRSRSTSSWSHRRRQRRRRRSSGSSGTTSSRSCQSSGRSRSRSHSPGGRAANGTAERYLEYTRAKHARERLRRRGGGSGGGGARAVWGARPSKDSGAVRGVEHPTHAIRQQTQAWLKQLAVLLDPPAAGSWAVDGADSITMNELKHRLPIPYSLIKHYGSATAVVNELPALQWAVGKSGVCLDPVFHRRLLEG